MTYYCMCAASARLCFSSALSHCKYEVQHRQVLWGCHVSKWIEMEHTRTHTVLNVVKPSRWWHVTWSFVVSVWCTWHLHRNPQTRCGLSRYRALTPNPSTQGLDWRWLTLAVQYSTSSKSFDVLRLEAQKVWNQALHNLHLPKLFSPESRLQRSLSILLSMPHIFAKCPRPCRNIPKISKDSKTQWSC